MAGINSIILHLDSIPQWNLLTDDEAGKLIKALLLYAQDGEQLTSDNAALKMAFSFMSAQIDRDGKKYEARCETNRRIAEEREKKRRAEREPNKTNVHEAEQADTNVHERTRTCTNVTNSNNNNNPNPNPNSESNSNNNAGAADEPQQAHSPEGSHSGSSFEPPSVEEVRAYCKSRRNSIDAQRFVDYHAAIGWTLGGNQIVDWKAVVRKWESMQKSPKPPDDKDSSIDMDVLEQIMNAYSVGDAS